MEVVWQDGRSRRFERCLIVLDSGPDGEPRGRFAAEPGGKGGVLWIAPGEVVSVKMVVG